MKIAILSDIHGNSIALDAVLADIASIGGVDAHWVIGDLVAIGIDPLGTLARIEPLPNLVCTRGNSEDYLLYGVSDDAPDPKPTNEDEWRHQIEISRNFGWTMGMLCSAEKQHFLAALPDDYRTILADGTRVLAVHASPGSIIGDGFRPDYSQSKLEQQMAGAEADLVFVGHTHWPMNQLVDDVHLVNVGCVSNQSSAHLAAQYVILETDDSEYTVEHRYVPYDRAACVAFCEAEKFPGHDFVAMLARGAFRPKWQVGYDSAELHATLPTPNHKYRRP